MSRSTGYIVKLIGASFLTSSTAFAASTELDVLKQQIAQLEKQVSDIEKGRTGLDEARSQGVKVGGAIRFNYSMTSYDEDAENRGGDIDFDLVRFNFSGDVADIGINAEIRFLDYMRVVKYAYIDHEFASNWEAQLGLAPVPFGNTPHGSHSYFMSPNYFVGLEEDYDLGLVFNRQLHDNWRLDLGFFKNDDHGGIDGGAQDREDRYSVDIVGVRSQNEGLFDAPNQKLAEYNTFVGRYAYQFDHQFSNTQVGFSLLHGGLHNGVTSEGNYKAWAVHISSQIKQWHLHFQHTQYEYQLGDVQQIAIGANAMYDTIAAGASSTNFGVAYDLKVNIGPITELNLYNDFGIVYDKIDETSNTWMNITGVSVSAGAVFAYIDLVHATNQPFIGGSIAGNGDDFERRFNINVGYYF